MGIVAKALGVGVLIGGGITAYYYREDIMKFLEQFKPAPPPPPPPECPREEALLTVTDPVRCAECGGEWWVDVCCVRSERLLEFPGLIRSQYWCQKCGYTWYQDSFGNWRCSPCPFPPSGATSKGICEACGYAWNEKLEACFPP